MHKIKPTITIGFLCMILTIGICIQLNTIRAADINGIVKFTDSNLKKSLLQWKSKCEQSNEKLESTSKELEDLRDKVSNTSTDKQVQSKIEKYQILLGEIDVKGEGIIITIADKENNKSKNSSFNDINNSNYIVHDGNLVAILNELKAAGAEAISIGEKRIVPSTCITCAGNVIQVNGEKIGSPFEIKAIGPKDLLYGELTKNGGTLYKLKNYGILTNIKKEDNIEITKNI